MEGFTQKTTKMEAVKEAAKWLNTAAPAKLKRASRKRLDGNDLGTRMTSM